MGRFRGESAVPSRSCKLQFAQTAGFPLTSRGCLLPAGGGRAMRELLGEKIGEGVTADIHVWAPGQVVKLFKPHVSRRFARREAQTTRAAFAAGAPEVFDEVTLEGRFGIV